MTIAIDFDGTIVRHEFPSIGPLMPNVLETIKKIQEAGHTIILWTCRDGKYLVEARSFMYDNGIVFDSVNDNPPDFPTHFAQSKIYADVYIDDRNIGGFIGWDRVAEILGL